jgi:hypothetical protein
MRTQGSESERSAARCLTGTALFYPRHNPALAYSRARHGTGTGGPGSHSMGAPSDFTGRRLRWPMAARVPDPSLGVPRTDTRLGEPGTARIATPRAGPNRCATGPGVASGPQVTSDASCLQDMPNTQHLLRGLLLILNVDRSHFLVYLIQCPQVEYHGCMDPIAMSLAKLLSDNRGSQPL